MKVFITEFRMGDTVYEGPCICAETFEEAEKEAERAKLQQEEDKKKELFEDEQIDRMI